MTKIAKISQLGPGKRSTTQVVNGRPSSPSKRFDETDIRVDVRQAQNGVFLVRGPQGQIVTCTTAIEIGNAIRDFFQLPPEASLSGSPSGEREAEQVSRKSNGYRAPEGFGLGDQMIVEGASWLVNKAQQGSRSGMGSMGRMTRRLKGTASRRKKKKK